MLLVATEFPVIEYEYDQTRKYLRSGVLPEILRLPAVERYQTLVFDPKSYACGKRTSSRDRLTLHVYRLLVLADLKVNQKAR